MRLVGNGKLAESGLAEQDQRMIVTVAFDVKNHVEVMEGWPIELGNTSFFLEREANVLKRVCGISASIAIHSTSSQPTSLVPSTSPPLPPPWRGEYESALVA
ncbi:hypothetical protein [Sphingobium sp. Cam5-1]|uniref:hypothetical protein n=1 Tax=Sphingobium sp. Cam5-1 TaxID=2789327 RepID=UPI0018AD251F|nr:hypothetical protein [Sphingobium sp. Cam5-1]QPI72388.1 hypothetical protein IZV00_10920 [Sphingobium sp. Cam5-1]